MDARTYICVYAHMYVYLYILGVRGVACMEQLWLLGIAMHSCKSVKRQQQCKRIGHGRTGQITVLTL